MARGVYLIDDKGAHAVLGGAAAELDFRVETANALRAVLRIEGWYVREDGSHVARAVMRYHLHFGQPWMCVEHHFILTQDNTEVSFREVGITLPLQTTPSARALFGVKDAKTVAVALNDQAREAFIFQSRHPVYYKQEMECLVGGGGRTLPAGKEAQGWCDLSNGTTGVMVAVKDFAPQFPTELCADAQGITAKLWSGRDGKLLDYKPATLAKDWWGDWLGRVNKIAPSSVDSLFTPEQITARNPSCVGVARTHELIVGWYAGAQDEARARLWHGRSQTPPVVYPDPRWTCHVDPRCFWPMAAAGEGGEAFADVEAFISTWFDEFMLPLKVFPYAGWYDWGKHGDLRYVKEPAEDNRIYAQWWRVCYNNQYQTTKHLMLGWARSGERRFLEAAQRFIRFQLDYKVLHWGGGSERKHPGYFVWGSVHQLPYWYSGDGVLGMTGDTEFITGPALEYLFLDNRWARDTLELVKKAVLADFSPTARMTKQTPDMVLSYMVGLYRVLPDAALKAKIEALYHAITDVKAPLGLSEPFFAEIGTHYTPGYKINRKSVALIEYTDVLGGDETSRQIAAKAATGAAAREAGGNFCDYCEFYGASNSRIWQWTHDPRYLEPVRYQMQGLREQFALYQKLPAEKRLEGHFREFAPANPQAQSGPHSTYYFPESGLKGQDGKAMPLSFGTPTSGVAFLSLPTAIWALRQSGSKP